MTDALVIIDMQNDYFSGGNMELSGIDVAAENTKKLLLFLPQDNQTGLSHSALFHP